MSKKLAHKHLSLHAMSEFLPRASRALKRYWEEDLQQQLNQLPPLEEVLAELQDILDKLVAPHISFGHASAIDGAHP